MITEIYKKSLAVLAKKPWKLWGISLLEVLLVGIAWVLTGAVPVIAIAISILLDVSMTMIFLDGYLGEEPKAAQLFDTFRSWETVKRVLGGSCWAALWIFIWGLIPIVGIVFAFIRAYEYRFVPYILMKEPDVKITDALKVSKERTMGYKAKMFWADILWVVIVAVAAGILSALARIRFIGWIFLLAYIALELCIAVFSNLFAGLIQATFYVEIEKKREGSAFYEEPVYPTISTDIHYCPNCGAAVREGHSFCSACGAKLKADEAEPAPEQPAKNAETQNTPETAKPQKDDDSSAKNNE